MKKLTKLGKKLYVPALVLACSIGFASCSDDDNNTPPVTITIDEMYGNYEGKMAFIYAALLTRFQRLLTGYKRKEVSLPSQKTMPCTSFDRHKCFSR